MGQLLQLKKSNDIFNNEITKLTNLCHEDLESINPEKQAIRIGSSVGNRKRLSIHDRADDLGLRILNRRRIDRKGDLQ